MSVQPHIRCHHTHLSVSAHLSSAEYKREWTSRLSIHGSYAAGYGCLSVAQTAVLQSPSVAQTGCAPMHKYSRIWIAQHRGFRSD